MSDSILEFVAKTEKMAKEIKNLEQNGLRLAARIIKDSVRAEMATAGAANGRLRGVGKRGARIGVRDDIRGNTALVRATGPFHLLESDTKAHRIPKQRGARAKKRVVVIPGVGVRAYAQSPGTKGKHPWAKGVTAGIPLAGKADQIALTKSLGKVFG